MQAIGNPWQCDLDIRFKNHSVRNSPGQQKGVCVCVCVNVRALFLQTEVGSYTSISVVTHHHMHNSSVRKADSKPQRDRKQTAGTNVKRLVQLKMKVLSSFTHPLSLNAHVDPKQTLLHLWDRN